MKSSHSSSLAEDTTAMAYGALGAGPAPVAQGSVSAPREPSTFGPDVILPEQFYDKNLATEKVSGERALMLAVLEDGIRCYQEYLGSPRVRPRLMARQAEKWIRSADWEWPFSFNNICESLSLDPESLRERLLATHPEQQEAPRPRPSSHRVYRLTPRVKPQRQR